MVKNKFEKGIFLSLLAGIIIWLVLFVIIPVKQVVPFKTETVLYVLGGYLSIFVGYYVARLLKPPFGVKLVWLNKYSLNKWVLFLLIAVSISYFFRLIDLFYVRGMRFSNTADENRVLVNWSTFNMFFVLCSIVKSLYFSPLIVLIAIRSKKKYLIIASCFLFLFPLIEAVLLGTRKPFLEIFLIIALSSLLFFKKDKLVKLFVGLTILFSCLILVSGIILKNRIEDQGYRFEELIDAKYNDLLPPNDEYVDYVNNLETSGLSKDISLLLLHFGQYYTHGLFEFNYLVENKESLPRHNGGYTFYTVPKFLNTLGFLGDFNDQLNSPREIVYLTTFGGLYLDFRWWGMVLFVFYGILLKTLTRLITESFFWSPLFIYFLIINVFLPSVNYIRGAGIYPLISFLLIITVIRIIRTDKDNETSTYS